MRWSLRDDRSAAIALAVLRALLVAVIFASERLVDARRLAGWPFDLVLVTQAIESVERERTRLAGALHDLSVQNLMAARHDLRRAERSGDVESFRRVRRRSTPRSTSFVRRSSICTRTRSTIPPSAPHRWRAAMPPKPRPRSWFRSPQRLPRQIERCSSPSDASCSERGQARSGHTHPMHVARNGRTVVVAVSDDGCGIAPGRLRPALLDGQSACDANARGRTRGHHRDRHRGRPGLHGACRPAGSELRPGAGAVAYRRLRSGDAP